MTRTWTCVALFGVVLAGASLASAGDLDWWKNTVFYQIYPRSFKDSDGDGTGDLKGIISKLAHLKDLGVGGIWMSPIFKSPMADFGYDVSDFNAIDPLFGNMDDFGRLVNGANKLGIKVILDFVPNHTSDQHEWFQGSRINEVWYMNYFMWVKPRVNETGSPLPPNDWMGSFSESVWSYNSFRQQYYYHRYSSKQPDLNYRYENVREEMKDILRFWLDKGVHGFRVDSIHTLVENDSFPDVPDSESDKYCVNQPMTYDIVRDWRTVLEEYTARDNVTRVMMLEAYGTQDELVAYYGNETHPGAHFTFNFQFISTLNNDSKAQDYVDAINDWIKITPNASAPNWVIGNHDNARVAFRYGRELAAGIAMLSLLLPGIGVIYNGEEIGMVNNMDISYEETLDPAGVNAGPDNYLQASRDFERTPFQWDDTKDAGFSTANKTWLPVASNFKKVNLATEKDDPSSYYYMYKSLLEARQTDTIKSGSLTSVAVAENVVAISRDLEGADSYLVLVNVGEIMTTVDLNAAFGRSLPTLSVYTSNVAANLTQNATMDGTKIDLLPKASVVLKTTGDGSGSDIITANVIAVLLSSIAAIFFRSA